ncbi:MAG TPA: aminopeptidase [Myxococcales bacterium]|jgi:leucyl aminopeptidase (aminopeptidase T)
MTKHSIASLLMLFSLPALAAEPARAAAPAAKAAPAAPAAAAAPAEPARPSVRDLARKLVVESAGVKEGDLVLVTGTFEDRDLLEDLAVAIRRAGGNPLVLVDSDTMLRRFYSEVPEKYDAQAAAVRAKLAETADVRIRIDRGDAPDTQGEVPATRVATTMESFEKVHAIETKRGIRRVVLGNGLYPTEANAKKFGMTLDQLTRVFWDGIGVDNKKLLETGDKVRARLAKGKLLEITSRNGTSLKMKIEGRPVLFSDGIISPEELRKGGAATMVWLPAGEVYFVPVPGTAEGTLVIDRQLHSNQEIKGLTLKFAAGKLTSMTSKDDISGLKAEYEAAPMGRDVFALVDIGLNPNVKVPAGSRLLSYLPAGTTMIQIGGNGWAGGENNIFYNLQSFLSDATIKVDGKVLVESGALKP